MGATNGQITGSIERQRGTTLVKEAGRSRESGGQSRQAAASHLGDVALAVGQRHRHQRQRILRC